MKTVAVLGRGFLICPVRDNPEYGREITERLEAEGYTIHWPARDTNQDDAIGLQICKDNLSAIQDADVIFIAWDGKSTGSLFDAGMAFALGKKVIPIELPPSVPGQKSFQAMLRAYAKVKQES